MGSSRQHQREMKNLDRIESCRGNNHIGNVRLRTCSYQKKGLQSGGVVGKNERTDTKHLCRGNVKKLTTVEHSD